MPRMIHAVVLISIFAVGIVCAQSEGAVVNPIEEFLQVFRDTSEVVDVSNRVLYKLVADFNNDGKPDLAITDSFTGGAQNAEYEFFLIQANGKYRSVGAIWFEDILAIRPVKQGIALVTVYSHFNASEGTIEEYKLSLRGIRLVRHYSTNTDVISPGNLPGSTTLTDSCCKVVDLLRDLRSR